MRRRRKIKRMGHMVECKRGCGKTIYTTFRSLTGSNSLHAKYSGICQDCTTPDEKHEMLYGTADAILRSVQK